MDIVLIQLLSTSIDLLIAAYVFLAIFNRWLILLPEGRAKVPFIAFILVLFSSIAMAAGYVFTAPIGIYSSALLLFAITATGEAHRATLRKAYSGYQPRGTTPHAFQILKPFTTTDLIVHRYTVAHPKWRGAPLKIAHLTDLHVHERLPDSYYQNAMLLAEKEQADVALFTGDYINNLKGLPKLSRILRPVAKHASLATLGNHDYWSGENEVCDVIRNAGLQLLSDDTTTLSINGNDVTFSGHDSPWSKPGASLPPTRDDTLHIVLSHTADNIYRIAETSADFTFSGHYHAGQMRIPWLGSIVVPSIYGRRFDHGHFIVNNTHLFVASGIGAGSPPVRVYCQPDIFIVEITATESGSPGT